MQILVAPNAFKGTIEADHAAQIIAETLQAKYPQADITQCPIADGGDGTCRLLGEALQWQSHTVLATDARGRDIEATCYFDTAANTVCADVSSASGIRHLSLGEKDVWSASTFGTGQTIADALKKGAQEIILGLGGSASVDMGLGILQALGLELYDADNQLIKPFSFRWLERITRLSAEQLMPLAKITCLCDVDNTFFGAQGAIPVFAPQKGLQAADMPAFTANAERIFQLLRQLNPTLADRPCFGAAGGIALGLSAFYPVEIRSGSAYFFEAVQMEQRVAQSDWIITGEGRYDFQSESGKGCHALLLLAKKHGKRISLISSGSAEMLANTGFDDIYLLPPLDFGTADVAVQAVANLREVFYSNT
ncbi:glycerate kinase [Rhodoflexus caldus]|uniref:glycerate kinase n=1 Tax=Rhodoflexus caldus TaxID=2891236 RepID=UPI002029DAE1|nr:glycerate kinase [Rhodoflexus caldus]